MLSGIAYGYQHRFNTVKTINSKLCVDCLGVVKFDGWIEDFIIAGEFVIITLKYIENQPAIHYMKCLSMPGRPICYSIEYLTENEPRGSIYLFTDDYGVLSYDGALICGVGGLALFELW